jgi:hypothetical protein
MRLGGIDVTAIAVTLGVSRAHGLPLQRDDGIVSDGSGLQPGHGPCLECLGTRAVPDDVGEHEDGYAPCPLYVINGGAAFVAWE